MEEKQPVGKWHGHTSNKVKYRYQKKAYDQVSVRLPKGDRDTIRAAADREGLSMAQYIRRCLVLAGCPLEPPADQDAAENKHTDKI